MTAELKSGITVVGSGTCRSLEVARLCDAALPHRGRLVTAGYERTTNPAGWRGWSARIDRPANHVPARGSVRGAAAVGGNRTGRIAPRAVRISVAEAARLFTGRLIGPQTAAASTAKQAFIAALSMNSWNRVTLPFFIVATIAKSESMVRFIGVVAV